MISDGQPWFSEQRDGTQMAVAGVLVAVLAEALRARVVFVRNMNFCGLERRPNGLICCKHRKGKRLRNHDCACTDLQLPSQQIEDVDDAVTCLHCDMESPDELEARRRGLRQASQVQVACNCRLRAAEQPGSLQCACSRAASAYSAPKATCCAAL